MILPSLARVVARFATDTIQIAHPGAVTVDVHGVAARAPATLSSARAHVERPASGPDLQHLPEGDRVKRTCVVWTASTLAHGDIVTLEDGEAYELQAIEPWGSIAGYTKAIGVRVQA